MADGITVHVNIELSNIEKKFSEARFKKIQYSLANKIIKDSDQYVPKNTGNLRGHIFLASDGTTIHYGASYATYQYHKQYKHYTTPGTGPRWIEKAEKKKSKKWVELVKRGLLSG